jgi:hypothetical protein
MISTVVLLALTLTATPIKVATMRLNLVGLSETKADFYTDHLSDRLGEQGLLVTSPREVATVLGMERQKQLLGCEESSCVAEIANALGVDGLVLGDIAMLGSSYQVNLKVIEAQSGKKLATFSAMVSSEAEVVTTITEAVEKLANDVSGALGRPLGVKKGGPKPVTPVRLAKYWWAPAILAAVGVGLTVVGAVNAADAKNHLLNDPFTTDLHTYVDQGNLMQTLEFVGIGVAAAGVIAMAGFLIFGREAPVVTPTVQVSPGGAGVSLVGVFP